MGKSNGLHIEVEARPVEQSKIIETALHNNVTLKKVKEKFDNPDISPAFGDRLFYYLSKAGGWLMETGSKFVGKAFSQIVPPYVWVASLVMLAVAIGIVLFVVL